MRLGLLHLQQFRSYSSLVVDFSAANVHLLLGANGAGKTNILEGISLLSLTKSCQKADEQDLIYWGQEYYRVQGQVLTDDDEKKQLEVVSQIAPRKQKACYINDVKKSIADMVGVLPTVVFLPQDLELFTGPPGERRTFMDQLLCQVSPEYLQLLSQYQKTLKQRNSLLRKIADGIASTTDLSVWNLHVATLGATITLRRLELIEMLQCTLGEELTTLGEDWGHAQLQYLRKSEARDQSGVEQELLQRLENCQKRDIALQSTTVGPHRDDWALMVDERNIATFASRGQQRTAVLALLFLQVSFLELQRGEKPVILLDDVFSELDDHHQTSLLQSLSEHQVIITTTHIPSTLHGAQVWRVEEGVVTEQSASVVL